MLGYHGKVTRRLAAAAAGSVLLLAFAGCAREDQNALVVYGPDSVVVVATLAIPATGTEPGGIAEANQLELVSFDPSALDAFGRSTQPFTSGQYPYWRSSGYWRFGYYDGDGIGWGYSDTDPRLPALTLDSTDCTTTGGVPPCYDFDYFYFAVQGVFAGTGYDIYGEGCCLEPNTRYIVTLDRMQLTVNGELDAEQVLLGQPVTEPDELSWLGGHPAGDYTWQANLFDDGNPIPWEDEGNPFVQGYIDTDVDGYVYIDNVVACTDAAGVQIVMCDATPNQSLSMVAPNYPTRWGFPAYNYMTLWEANMDGSPNYDAPVVRYQIGVDLSPLGGPINNAYAPFPRAALSDAQKALGTGAVSRPDSVTFTLDNLKELDGGAAYQVWAVMSDGSSTGLDFLYTPPGGTQSTETSFIGGEGDNEVVIEYPDDATYIVFTIESSAGATTPSDAQIIWSPGLQEAGEVKSADLPVQFGSFSEARTYSLAGVGGGGLFGDQLRYEFQQLPRPPVGYKYVGWLASGDTMFTQLPDATYTTPPADGYQELTDADVDDSFSSYVQPSAILESMSKICVTLTESVTNCFDLLDYDTFFLSLEPKDGVFDDGAGNGVPGPTRIQQGVLPGR